MDAPVTEGMARIVQPGEAPGFWQPVPANGYVECLLDPSTVTSDTPFAMGRQTVDVGCHVREHTHDRHEEIIHFIAGEATVMLDGVAHPAVPGTTVFLGKGRRHAFINAGDVPFTFVWFLMPSGLERFFAAIGRPREAGEPAPAPFPRPADVAEIERRTVFGWADQTVQKPGA
ncbi:cupin domain-containing protein [Elioraea sp.]|uniref:cupin domain-containing protein n=1 Tax=Elioraea sp. TaxID=2185103 RepID=UPI0025BE8D5D|nr:cupin domain-containing protein [Elioraea sp.]